MEQVREKYSDKSLENSGESGIIKNKEKKEENEDEIEILKTLKKCNIEYNEVKDLDVLLTEEEIIDKISGGDLTTGSCASVALAYVGNMSGYDVLDFRGGSSMDFFSSKANKVNMFNDLGVKSIVANSAKSNLTNGKRIMSQLVEGKEYYLSVGRHAAIVRNKQGTCQYLELQLSSGNGWKDFGNITDTLKRRFGCSSSSNYYSIAYATDISQLEGENFKSVLGYINTVINKQKKGTKGYAK